MPSAEFHAGFEVRRAIGQAVGRAAMVLGAIAVRVIFGGAALAAGNPFGDGRFNAFDGAAGGLMVAVGNHGTIFHSLDGESASRLPSHTKRDLLNVRVSSRDFAVAVGQGIVLLWDGIRWKPVVRESKAVTYSQAWISPVKALVLYGGKLHGEFRLCSWMPGAAVQAFCRRFDAPMRAACGDVDEIFIVLANGDVHRVNSALIGKNGSFDPVYHPPTPMNLTKAWFPNQACDSRYGFPRAFAGETNGRMMNFDGVAWRALDTTSRQRAMAPAGFSQPSEVLRR